MGVDCVRLRADAHNRLCVCVCVCVETCHFHRALPCKTLTQPPEEVPPASAFH